MNFGTDLRETVKPLKSMAILKRAQDLIPKTQRTRNEQRPTRITTPQGSRIAGISAVGGAKRRSSGSDNAVQVLQLKLCVRSGW